MILREEDASALRIVVTGATGFVGPYLAEALRRQAGRPVILYPTALIAGEHRQLGTVHALDVTDKAQVAAFIREAAPTHVVHLAGLAATSAANANESLAWQVHLFGTLNLAHAILVEAPGCVLLSVGTGQVYGATARSGRVLDESAVLAPTNIYEVTKAAGDLAVRRARRAGISVDPVQAVQSYRAWADRRFRHSKFCDADCAHRSRAPIAGAESRQSGSRAGFPRRARCGGGVCAGGCKVRRDRAGNDPQCGVGVSRRIQSILDRLMALSRVPISTKIDNSKMRPSETPRYVGDATLAKKLLGWSPSVDFDTTLAAVLDDCRARVASQV